MPPKKKFSKEQIIDKAIEIAKSEGVESITARRISDELKCSVAPIYVNFKDIKELKKAVIRKIFEMAKKLAQKTYIGDQFLDLEKHSILGGECTAWDRDEYHIDGCIHWLVETKTGTPMNDF